MHYVTICTRFIYEHCLSILFKTLLKLCKVMMLPHMICSLSISIILLLSKLFHLKLISLIIFHNEVLPHGKYIFYFITGSSFVTVRIVSAPCKNPELFFNYTSVKIGDIYYSVDMVYYCITCFIFTHAHTIASDHTYMEVIEDVCPKA